MAGSGPRSPESVSSARPVVSGLGLSSASSSGSAPVSPPPSVVPEQARRPVQERLVWQQPKLSRKAAWRRRKREKLLSSKAEPSRPVAREMKGVCFRCLEKGHPKFGCLNEEVCIHCTEEGHNSGGCKRPRSPESEDELRRQALAAVALRKGGAGSSRPAGAQIHGLASTMPALYSAAARQATQPTPSMPVRAEAVVQSVAGELVGVQGRLEALPCIIPRSGVVNDLEHRLRFAMVAYVGGSRPAVSCQLVADALVSRVHIPREAFSMHRYLP
jgi:hypothetical protein